MIPPVDAARERIAQLVVTLRDFVGAAGASAAVLLLDQGEGAPPLLIESPAGGPATLSEGEDVVALDAARLAAAPLPLPEVRALGPFDVDALRAEVVAPLGGVEHLARAVRELADAFPGRSVLTVAFATSDPDTPLRLSARSGDPMVLSLGEEQFEMDPAWPGA
jgi:hypothetical protein